MKIRQGILDKKKYLLIQINENKLGTNTDLKVFCLLVDSFEDCGPGIDDGC